MPAPRPGGDPPEDPLSGSGVDPRQGMGSSPSGPSFAPGIRPAWTPAAQPPGPPPLRRPDPASFRSPTSRWPLIVTVAAAAVVGLVVALSSVIAYRGDREAARAPAASTSTPRPVATKDTIDFTTRTGTGQLRILDHHWQPARGAIGGEALQIRVELLARSGFISYDPFNFQAFDETGALYDLSVEEVRGPVLEAGVLRAGEQISGLVAFAMPRGEVTLLMSDDASSVTALKVPD